MKLYNEFKEFAVKGNMIDMAIGIIIGVAFNQVIDVLVKQVVMPPISLLTGNVNLGSKKVVLREAVQDASNQTIVEEVAIGYGLFIEVFIDFMIIGLTVFFVIKVMNRLKRKSQEVKDKTVVTPKDIELLSDLKHLMEEQNTLLKAK